MLTEEERLEIETGLKKHPNKRAACFEALRIVQKKRGWVSDEIGEIAELLDMTPDELDSVATFYTFIFRQPVGKHVIYICDSISCWVMGYEGILEHIKGRLGIGPGETTSDGRFTLLPVSCIGVCDHAPALMIDDETYRDITRERLDEILGK